MPPLLHASSRCDMRRPDVAPQGLVFTTHGSLGRNSRHPACTCGGTAVPPQAPAFGASGEQAQMDPIAPLTRIVIGAGKEPESRELPARRPRNVDQHWQRAQSDGVQTPVSCGIPVFHGCLLAEDPWLSGLHRSPSLSQASTDPRAIYMFALGWDTKIATVTHQFRSLVGARLNIR